ncbi:MAG: hypothetical protein M1826_004406 [Phylliscum demangeonii]|nr:MAG: hypothetical protein M1826_004406 [Phylliscum demangeonii]
MASFFDNRARAAALAAHGGASKPAAPTENHRLQPWVEKYRPKTLQDVTAQDHTVHVLQRTLQASNLPHMLFYGPPGTGKTSTVLALAKELFGPQLFKSRVLELNASDERGISIVRVKVKDFARMQLTKPPSASYTTKYPCPPYKIIILDEADSMTQDAQSALRRTMETYSRITRFCLICNYVTRIIDPLASRCSKFRFKSLDQANARARLAQIAEREGVPLAEGALDALIRCSDGDLRKAITFLQSGARLVGAGTGVSMGTGTGTGAARADAPKARKSGGSAAAAAAAAADDAMDIDEDLVSGGHGAAVTPQIVEEIAGVIPRAVIDRLVQAMQPRAPQQGAVYEAVAAVVTDMVADGWSASQVVSQLYQDVVYSETIPDRQKNRIVLVFSEVDKRLADGADEHLEILDLALRISGILAAA